jgi:hypothetical protein
VEGINCRKCIEGHLTGNTVEPATFANGRNVQSVPRHVSWRANLLAVTRSAVCHCQTPRSRVCGNKWGRLVNVMTTGLVQWTTASASGQHDIFNWLGARSSAHRSPNPCLPRSLSHGPAIYCRVSLEFRLSVVWGSQGGNKITVSWNETPCSLCS